MVTLTKVANRNYWNIITYIVDSTGVKTAAENITFVMDLADATDTILHINEVNSDFLTFVVSDTIPSSETFTESSIMLTGGTDKAADEDATAMMDDAIALATKRYTDAGYDHSAEYVEALNTLKSSEPDDATASSIRYMEWMYTYVIDIYDLLKDKLTYNMNFIVSPGWDDQNISDIDVDGKTIGGIYSLWTLIDIRQRKITKPQLAGITIPDIEPYDSFLNRYEPVCKDIELTHVLTRQALYNDIL